MGAAAELRRRSPPKLLQLLSVLIVCCCPPAVFSQSVTSLPVSIFQAPGGVRRVVEGSVIQLYCSVESLSVTFTWNKDNDPVDIDVPHLRERTCSSGSTTTSVLTIDNFLSSDNGTYQCMTMNGTTGDSVTLIAVSSTVVGTLAINSGPSSNEGSFEPPPVHLDNRTDILNGSSVDGNLLMCDSKHVGMSASTPIVEWIRNGELIQSTVGFTDSLMIMDFTVANTGVYQCIFIDADADAEIITTIPYRLDTDIYTDVQGIIRSTVFIERVSPEVIFLRPPEKLVIEVKASGYYEEIDWQINGTLQAIIPSDYPNYNEILVRGATDVNDVGLYEVELDPNSAASQFISPPELDFIVIVPVDASTTTNVAAVVSVVEENSITISCTSSGAPTPTITWLLDGQPSSITPSETQSDASVVQLPRPNPDVDPLEFDITPGSIMSSLGIVDARYPTDDGDYTCVGTNDEQMINVSSVVITVQVHVVPVVEVTATRTRALVGDTITLTCNVTTGDPSYVTYLWTLLSTSTNTNMNLSEATNNTLTLTIGNTNDFGNYTCQATNLAGSGRGTVIIDQGVLPVAITVQPPPVVVDTNVTLMCTVTEGDVPYTITWTFDSNGTVVYSGDETTGGVFTLLVSSDDYGTYTCDVTNEFGMDSSTIEVIQAVGPMLSPDAMDIEVVVGTSLVLEVAIFGFNLPITEVTWMKDSALLQDGEDNFAIMNDNLTMPNGTSTLTVMAMSPVLHSGTYEVSATNPAGSDSSTFSVTVTAPPTIVDPEQDVSIEVNETDDVLFTCVTRGFPASTIAWYLDTRSESDQLTSGGRIAIATSDPAVDSDGFFIVTSNLTILDSDRGDSSVYTCVANNTVLGEDRVEVRNFDLTVNFSVSIFEEPQPQDILAPAAVTLTCSSDGQPVPDIIWIKRLANGTTFEFTSSFANINITEDVNEPNKTSYLTIEPTTALDTANYSCRVQNLVGSLTSTEAEVNIFVGPSISSPQNGGNFSVNVTNDITITCTASALPPPTIEFFYNGMVLNRMDGETGLGDEIPMRVQIGTTSSSILIDNGNYEVSRNITLFNARDEPLTGFQCRAVNEIIELGNLMPNDTAAFEIVVQVPANITDPPSGVTVISPDNATLTCIADGVPAPDIAWLREFQGMLMEIPPMVFAADDSNVTLLEITQTLMGRTTISTISFFFTQPPFAAEYTCRSSNLLGTVQETAILTIQVIPVILEPDENTVITVDQFTPAMFDCSAAGTPAPIISWFRVYDNGTTEELREGRYMLLDPEQDDGYDLEDRGIVTQVNRTLNLTTTFDDDSGTYRCVATNEAGNDTQDFELVVQVPPMTLVSPMNVTVTEGEDAIFTCRVTGRPRPSISWFYRESPPTMLPMTMPPPLNETDGNYGIDSTEFGSREFENNLTVFSTLPSDTGFYVCFAKNAVAGGIVMVDAFLSVEVPPMIQSVYPGPDQMSYTVNETETVTFSCSASGVPAPTITWSRNGEELNGSRVTVDDPSSMSFTRIDDAEDILLVTRTLQLANTEDVDSGTYMCSATNSAGNDGEQFELIVQIAPTITELSPLEQTLTSPAAAMITCNATGRPRPTIYWYRVELNGSRTSLPDDQSVEVTSGEREISSTLTVSPTSPFDAADYVCMASNVVDDDEMIANLTIYVNPMIDFSSPDGGVYVVNEMFPIVFMCNATGIPTPEIQWRRGSMILDPADNSTFAGRLELSSPSVDEPERSVSSTTRTLTVNNTMEGDAGGYSCVATNDAAVGRDDANFQLFVQVRPEVTPANGMRDITGEENGVVNLSFEITRATPSVLVSDIQWVYSPNFSETPFGGTMDVDITNLTNRIAKSTYMFSTDLLSLNISNIAQARRIGEPTDRGRYFLIATNPAGPGFSYINLLVAGPPVISVTPEDQFAINNGSSAVFTCGALAIPLHQVYWTFTGEDEVEVPIINTLDGMNTTKYQINNMNVNDTMNFGSLTVTDVRFEDRGTYTCNATNDIGSDVANATLTVHVFPVIERVSDNIDVVINNSTYLFCLATGFPVPSITWLKNGSTINLYSDVSLNMRIDIFEFDIRNESDVSSGFMGSGSIEEFLNSTAIDSSEIMALGDLGVVSFLRFYDVVREDTAMYSCVAVNELQQTARLRNESSSIQLTVLESPDAPENVEIDTVGARWVILRWTITFDGNRPVNRVRISVYSTSTDMVPEVEVDSGLPMYNVSSLLPFTNYTFGVVACNEIGCGLQSDLSPAVLTLNDTSTAPQSLMVESVQERRITVSWRTPLMPNGVISHYMLTAIGSKPLYDTEFSDKQFKNVSNTNEDMMMTDLEGLTPGTLYVITVLAVNGAGRGESASDRATTLNADPVTPGPEGQPSLGASQAENVRTVAVTFVPFDSTNGLISHYQVGVVLLPDGASIQNLPHPDVQFPTINGVPYDPSACNRAPPSVATAYITAEFASNLFPSDGVFIVGQEAVTDNSPNDKTAVYTNGLLCNAKSYTFFLRAYPVANPTVNQRRSVRQAGTDQRQYTSFSSTSYTAVSSIPAAPAGPGGIIAGVVVGVLLLIAIIIIIILIVIIAVRRHSVKVYNPRGFGTDMYDFSNDNFRLTDHNQHIDEGAVPHQPIPVASLTDHVERMHLNENCGFSEEYKVIQDRSAKHTVDACTAPDNKPRNRYANIQSYDHSRVTLTPIEGHEHDYINGNFIDGYNRKKEYIATQGPLPDTVGDFWRLVWDYKIPSVVMLTNLMEKMKVKCSLYWPNTGSQQYANINVTLINTIQQADFVIRHFQIKSVNSEEVREVRQFHFISWPDFGVPRHPTPLLYFLRRIRNSHPYNNEKPILIHCSAGVGRTGSLITIDVELQRARQKQVVDPFNYVLQMRDKRNHMVQTEGQYVFLHDAILEGYTSGDTQIVVAKLAKRMTELEAVDDEGISGFRKEFERLREFKVNVREFTDANDDANKFKNRIANALPYNYNRVHLKMSPGIGGSDYVNASFIDGYAQKMAYIATQGPLKNTVEDFWRLIWEKESGVIVMLTQLEEKGKEQCAQYWPQSKNNPEKMGSQLSVEILSEGAFEDYICRELKITDLTSTDNSHRMVKQFHFTAWPESGAPSTGAGMIDLIDQVIRTQQHTGNKPIIVHCSAGIGRTGAFCALSTAIERVKAEGIVDVFHTIKHLRTQRPHMVQTVDQYAFCYYAIKEYLESLSNYSNFDY